MDLNAGDIQTLHERLGRNSMPVHISFTWKHEASASYKKTNVSLILYIVGKQVYQWYMGRMTAFGKLTAEKSGNGAWIYTDREQWTLDKF